MFTIERQYASCVTFSGIGFDFQSCIDRKLLELKFPEINLSDVVQLSFEPERNLFNIVTSDNNVLVFNSPQEDARLKFIDDNHEMLYWWFYDQEQLNQKPSDYHTYNTATHAWEITPENNLLWETEKAKMLRAEEYRTVSDPLFFKAQRGEATMDEWLAAVEKIKAKYPVAVGRIA